MEKSFYAWEGNTLVLNILGTPNAKRDAIGKVKGHQLCVSVTAVPRAGRATDHMVRFLAREFGVPVDDIQVVFGRMNVNKQLRIKAPTSLPPISTVPASGESRHPTRCIKVDFPEPEGPTIATISPAPTSRSTPRKA